MISKVIAIDDRYAQRRAKEAGLKHFPVRKFIDLVNSGDGVDVLECLVTVIKRVPENETAEAIATVERNTTRSQHALEMQGATVIICPSKKSSSSPNGFKMSDDQRLMIATLSTCLKLRPRYLVFVGGDGDYSSMIAELRKEGIRTEVVAHPSNRASDLERVAFALIDIEKVFEKIKK